MEWLFKDDNYEPKQDKNKFIDKSIFAILNVLSLIKRINGKMGQGVIYRINPLLKIIMMMVGIVLLSLSNNLYFIMLMGIYSVIQAFMSGFKVYKKILTIVLGIFIFTLIVLLPSIIMGNIKNNVYILCKVIITLSIVNVVSYTTPWNEVTKVLKILCIPDIFIFVMDITIRYIFVLGDMALEMLYALKLRSIGRNNKKYVSLTKIIGNLFIKSKEMGEEMYSAMECRGFTGEYKTSFNSTFLCRDYIYATSVVGIILAYIITYRM